VVILVALVLTARCGAAGPSLSGAASPGAPAAALATLWTQLVGQSGAYQGIGAITTEPNGEYVNAAVETFFLNNTVYLLVTGDTAGAAAGLHLGQPGPASSAVTATRGPAPSTPARIRATWSGCFTRAS
jgi:hypothetical protein